MTRCTRFAAAGLLLATTGALADDVPTVSQRGKRFDTDIVELSGPGIVRFENDDTIRHNIALVTPGGESRTGIVQLPGESNPISFDENGRFQVHCLIHPQMRMTVLVR